MPARVVTETPGCSPRPRSRAPAKRVTTRSSSTSTTTSSTSCATAASVATPNGRCTIDDGYADLLRERVVPADGIVFATPIYWYGVAGQLKVYFDRMFCFIAASEPESDRFVAGVVNKRLALLMSGEETYPGAMLGLVHEIQEYARYTHSDFVGYVCGIGNKRGDVLRDPNDPIGQARELGRTLFERVATDYRIDTERAGSTWATLGADL